jgi:hypothetical protein
VQSLQSVIYYIQWLACYESWCFMPCYNVTTTFLVFAPLKHKNLVKFCQFYYIKISHILILFSNLRVGLPSSLYPSGFPTQNTYELFLCLMRATCPAVLVSVQDSFQWRWMRSSNRDPPHYVMCPSCMLLTMFWIWIHFSAPCSPTHPRIRFPLTWETKSHTNYVMLINKMHFLKLMF